MTTRHDDHTPSESAPESEAGEDSAASQPRKPWLTPVFFAALVAGFLIPPARPYAFTIAGLLAVVGIHEAGHLFAARAMGVGTPEFSIGFGPVVAETKPRPGKTAYKLRALPLGGFVSIKGMSESGKDVDNNDVPGKSFNDVAPWRQMIVAVAGPAANILSAFAIVAILMATVGVPNASNVVTPTTDSPATIAGITAGDRIVAVNGTTTDSWDSVASELRGMTLDTPVTVTIERDGAERTVSVLPTELDGSPKIGVQPTTTYDRLGPIEAVTEGAAATWRLTGQSLAALAKIGTIVTDIPAQFTGTTDTPEQRFLSPVGVARIGERTAENDGIAGPLSLAVVISIFLALFNLIPLPPLDGGHIVIAAYESVASRIRGRRVHANRRKLLPLTYAVAGFVLLIGISSILLDIIRPIAMP